MTRPVTAPGAAAAGPWRRLAPYAFMGMVFGLGFVALLLVMQSRLAEAGRVVLVAMALAGLEYPFRRLSAGPSSIENEFSTLSDILCFALVPGLLIYRLAFHGWGMLGLMALFVVVFSGVVRLSLYKIYNPVQETRGYVGIPLTITAAFIALAAQLVDPTVLRPEHRLLLLLALLVLSLLTVSTIRYPHPGRAYWLVLLSVLAVAALVVVPPLAPMAAWLLLGGGALYVLFAPLTMRQGGSGHA